MKGRVFFGLASLLSTTALANAQEAAIRLYDGALSLKDQKVWIQPWGNGTIQPVSNFGFSGASSVRVTSGNYFQGGTILFAEGRDLSKSFEDPSSYLRLTFLLVGASPSNSSKVRTLRKGTPGLVHVRRYETITTPQVPFDPAIKNVRMVIQTSDGKKSEAYLRVDASQAVGSGWRTVSIPLESIAGFDRTNKLLKNITLSTDKMSTIYVADLRVLKDTTPIQAEIEDQSRSIRQGAKLRFDAYGDAGITPLLFTWDFDASDGLQTDASGPTTTHTFERIGKYTITLTVSDFFGIKSAVHKTIAVTVTP